MGIMTCFIPILQLRKLSLQEVSKFSQGPMLQLKHSSALELISLHTTSSPELSEAFYLFKHYSLHCSLLGKFLNQLFKSTVLLFTFIFNK